MSEFITRNLEKRRADAELLSRSIPDLQEYAGAVFSVMRMLGIKTLVIHCDGGMAELKAGEI